MEHMRNNYRSRYRERHNPHEMNRPNSSNRQRRADDYRFVETIEKFEEELFLLSFRHFRPNERSSTSSLSYRSSQSPLIGRMTNFSHRNSTQIENFESFRNERNCSSFRSMKIGDEFPTNNEDFYCRIDRPSSSSEFYDPIDRRSPSMSNNVDSDRYRYISSSMSTYRFVIDRRSLIFDDDKTNILFDLDAKILVQKDHFSPSGQPISVHASARSIYVRILMIFIQTDRICFHLRRSVMNFTEMIDIKLIVSSFHASTKTIRLLGASHREI